MTIQYQPKGVCARMMQIEITDGVIEDITITGGCNGNLKGICALVKGRKAEEVEGLLRGIHCGMKSTSCPDQLACALAEFREKI